MSNTVNSKPLVDQVIDALLSAIEAKEEFDTSTIERLKHLASSGALSKAAQVTQTIKVVPGDEK